MTSSAHEEYAADRMKWLLALMERGFSREEAMAILTAPQVTIAQPGLSAEMVEFMTKMNVLANDAISER